MSKNKNAIGLFILLAFFVSGPAWSINGDPFGRTYSGDFGAKLLDSQTESSNGVWIDTSAIKAASYCFSGLESGGSVTIQVLNEVNIPSNSTDGFTIVTITSSGNQCAVISGYPARWTKAKKTAGGTATATTILFWGLAR